MDHIDFVCALDWYVTSILQRRTQTKGVLHDGVEGCNGRGERVLLLKTRGPTARSRAPDLVGVGHPQMRIYIMVPLADDIAPGIQEQPWNLTDR